MKIKITSDDSNVAELLHKTIISDMLAFGYHYVDLKIIPDGYELEFERFEWLKNENQELEKRGFY